MKKFLLLAVLSLTLAGCSKSPDEKLIRIINDATEKMKEAKTMEEAEKVNKDFVADISEFEKENKDAYAYDAIEKDKAKKEAVEAAGQGYTKVMMEKFFELTSTKQLAQ